MTVLSGAAARTTELLTAGLAEADPAVARLVETERHRQRAGLHLLAPSMLVSRAVRECLVSALLNLDGEGYVRALPEPLPDYPEFAAAYRRRGSAKYNPSGPVAEYLEGLARARIARLLSRGTGLAPADLHVNVQPASGSLANLALFRGVLRPGETVVSLAAASGGHLSHGAPFHASGRDYRVVPIRMDVDDSRLDPAAVAAAVAGHRPRLVVIGASSFPRRIDWRGIAEALRELHPRPVFAADVAHFAGLVAAGAYPNPLPWADVVSFVGYKTLGGPKSGVLVTRSGDLARRLDRTLFPGLQGAPRLADVAALATAAEVAGTDTYRELIRTSVRSAAALVRELAARGGPPAAFGGTDTHMVLLKDCTDAVRLAARLERVGILLNANMLPADPGPGSATGLRLGTVAVTQRGLREDDVPALADLLIAALRDARAGGGREEALAAAVSDFVADRLGDLD